MAEWSTFRHLRPNPNPDSKVRDIDVWNIDVLKVDIVEVDQSKQATLQKSLQYNVRIHEVDTSIASNGGNGGVSPLGTHGHDVIRMRNIAAHLY